MRKATISRKTADLPAGIQLDDWADVSYYLKGRLDMMVKNLIMGAALVFLILALFLRLKLAFWVMVGLPIAFMGAFFLMPTVDVTVNMLSLFGFILVLGIVVDDAIVIGESAYTNMRAKGHSVDNIVEGVLKVAVPATFGVLTTIAAFLPILLVTGISGQFFAAIGWVVILCLTFSLVESKLILPAHLAHMKVKHYEKDTHNVFIRFQRFFSEGLHRVIDDHYAPFLKKALAHRYLTLSVFVSMLILSIGLLAGGILRFVFFPDLTADFLQVELEMAEGTPPANTHDALRQITEALWALDAEVSAEQGVESGAVVNSVMAFANSDTSGQIITELVKENEDVIDGPEVLRRWRENVGTIPGVKTLGFEGATGPGGGPSISLQLIGSNIEQVGRAANDLEERIRRYEGVFDVRNSYERGTPEIKLTLARIAGKADARGIEAIFTVTNPRPELRLGTLLAISVARPAHDNSVALPYSALYGNNTLYTVEDSRLKAIAVERVGETLDEQGNRRVLVRSSALESGMPIVTTHLPNAMTGLKVDTGEAAAEPAQ